MKKVTVDLLDNSSNYVVLRTEGRKFPGIVVQGDGLKNMVLIAKEAQLAFKNNDIAEAHDAMGELHDELISRIRHYEQVLKEHGLELPYHQRFTE